MSIGKAAVIPALLTALGAAQGAEADLARSPGKMTWEPGRRDPLECCPKTEAPLAPPANAAELARLAEEQLALGNIGKAERLADDALGALRVQGAGDREVEARLRSLIEKTGGARTESETIKGFRGLKLSLSGVAWSKSNPVALINGRLCVPGDVVEGATIDRIFPGEVVFVFNGVRVRESLRRPSAERARGSRVTGGPARRK